MLEFRIPMEYNHPSKIYVKHYKRSLFQTADIHFIQIIT